RLLSRKPKRPAASGGLIGSSYQQQRLYVYRHDWAYLQGWGAVGMADDRLDFRGLLRVSSYLAAPQGSSGSTQYQWIFALDCAVFGWQLLTDPKAGCRCYSGATQRICSRTIDSGWQGPACA